MTTLSPSDERWRLISELDALLRQVWSDHPPEALDPALALTGIGVSSGHYISFLSRVETYYDLDWEEVDPSSGALASLGGIADTITGGLTSQPTQP